MNTIKVVKIESVFEPTSREIDEVTWVAGKSVADYVPEGMGEIIYSINSIAMERQIDPTLVFPKAGDQLTYVEIPQGGDDAGKSFLRLAAFAALAVAAPIAGAYAAGALFGGSSVAAGVLTAGVQIAGSMVVNSILPASPSEGTSEFEDGSSYGVSGAGNTSQEGIVVPMVYGEFRTGGNIVEYYTENVGTKNQNVTLLICIGEAPIEGISDIYINDQPIANYSEWVYHLKTDGAAIKALFQWGEMVHHDLGDIALGSEEAYDNAAYKNGTSTQFSKGVVLTENYITHTTAGSVDAIKVDILAPSGLAEISDSTRIGAHTVPITMEYREAGTTDVWSPIRVDSVGANDIAAMYHYDLDYIEKEPAGTGQSYAGAIVDTPVPANNTWTSSLSTRERVEWDSKFSAEGVVIRSYAERYFEYNDENKGTIEAYEQIVATAYRSSGTGGTEVAFVTGQSRQALRYSFRQDFNEEKFYEIRVKRDNEQQAPDSETVSDEVYLENVWEIETDEIGYKNLSMLALRIQLSDQLSGLPTVTFNVKGRKIKVWTGNSSTGSWSTEYNNNPAWVAYDILTNELGGDIDESKIDFQRWIAWAEHCVEKGLEFNGIFDYQTNVWDGLQHVVRCGHAQVVKVGTRYSVAVEKIQAPSMMFGNGNIIEGTFQSTWLPMEERANEIDVTYHDREDLFARHTIKVYDESVFSDKQRTSSLTMMGVTDQAQAEKEAALRLNMNKLVRQTVSFETGIDALGIIPGDIITVQNDHPQWGFSGRTIENTTTLPNVIMLDSEVTMEASTAYAIAILHPQLVIAEETVLARGVDWIQVSRSDLMEQSNELTTSLYVSQNGVDYRVSEIFDGNKLVVDRTPTSAVVGDTCVISLADAIKEYPVNTAPGTKELVTLADASALAEQLPKGIKWTFGEVDRVSKPFRVKSVEMGGDSYSRKIKASEYDDNVYSETVGDFQPVDYSVRFEPIGDVVNLQVDELYELVDDVSKATAVLTWEAPESGVYVGAEVYVSINGAPFTYASNVVGAEMRYEYATNVLDYLVFKVQARGEGGSKYPYTNSSQADVLMEGHASTSTGDVLLPDDHYRGGSGDVWFSRHSPVTVIQVPAIVEPTWGYVGAGAIRVYGDTFLHPDGASRSLTHNSTNSAIGYRIIDTPFVGLFQFRPFYMCYSDESIATRFPTMDLGKTNQFNFFVTSFDEYDGQWRAVGADGVFLDYEPVESDCLVGRGSKISTEGGIDILTSFLSVDINLPSYAAGENIQTFHQDTAPDATSDSLNEGDMWIDTSDGNHMYRWTDGAWVSIRDAGISAALESAYNAEQSLDQRVSLLFSPSAPTTSTDALSVGDIWFNITASYRDAHKWNGTQWIGANDDLLVDACRDATQASDISDGVINLFLTGSEPTLDIIDDGDMWYSGETKDLSRRLSGEWILYSSIGTLWDDVDGDGKPDDFVGNTGDQMLIDYNFEVAASGVQKTWQSFISTGIDTRDPPLIHEESGNVQFSASGGEQNSASAIMYGAGTSNYIHLRSPVLYSASPGSRYRFTSLLSTNMTVSNNGYEGYGIVLNYYDSNFNLIRSSSIEYSDEGPTFSAVSDQSWNRQNNVIQVPRDAGNIAYMTVNAIFRGNNGDWVKVSEIECIRQDMEIYETQLGQDGNPWILLGESYFYSSYAQYKRVILETVEVQTGESFELFFEAEVDHADDDNAEDSGNVGYEYDSGIYYTLWSVRNKITQEWSNPELGGTSQTSSGDDRTGISMAVSGVADYTIDAYRVLVVLQNGSKIGSTTSGNLSDFFFYDLTSRFIRREAFRSGSESG